MKPKNLEELSLTEFNVLKDNGLLNSIYPNAPKSYADLHPSRPKPIENPDLSSLIKMCENHLNNLEQNGYDKEDFDHYVYEEVLNIIYGETIWNFINNKNHKIKVKR